MSTGDHARVFARRAHRPVRRAGDNIRAYMACVRKHHVTLDPTVMVALMSMLVLEGWQFRLDPSTSIVQAIEQQIQGNDYTFENQKLGKKNAKH